MERVTEALKNLTEAKNKLQIDSINSLSHEKKLINNRLSQMYMDRLDNRITTETYDNLQQNQSKRLRDIDVELSKLTSSQENFYITAERTLRLVSNAKQLFDYATISEKNNILKLITYNSSANGKEYRLSLQEPFKSIFNYSPRTPWQALMESLRTNTIEEWLVERLSLR